MTVHSVAYHPCSHCFHRSTQQVVATGFQCSASQLIITSSSAKFREWVQIHPKIPTIQVPFTLHDLFISHTALNLPGRSNWTIFPWSFQCKSPLPGSSTKLRALRVESYNKTMPRHAARPATIHDVCSKVARLRVPVPRQYSMGKGGLSHTTLEEHFSCNPASETLRLDCRAAGVSHTTPVVSGNLHMNVTSCFSFKEQNNNAMPMAEA